MKFLLKKYFSMNLDCYSSQRKKKLKNQKEYLRIKKENYEIHATVSAE
jgi:hypothetical protein